MKLNEIKDPKTVEVEPEKASMFLRPQAGHKLSKYDKAVIKRKLARGHVPMFLKKQAE
jgi:hypothetical protein